MVKAITADAVRSHYDGSIKSLDTACVQLQELAVACVKSGQFESAGIMLYGMIDAIKSVQNDMERAKPDVQSVVNGNAAKSVSGKRFMNSKMNNLDSAAKQLVDSTNRIIRIKTQQKSALRRVGG